MAEEKIINAVKRDADGTSAARRLRVSGKIPAVVYGAVENQSVALDAHKFGLLVRDFGHNFVGDLVIDGAVAQKVLLKDLQYAPASGAILHADLVAISMTDKLQVSLPIEVIGDAPGVTAGGMMEQILAELEIECLPADMVENIVVNIDGMEIGDSISIGDLKMPEGVVSLAEDSELTVVSIAAPRKVEDEEGEEGGEGGEGAEGATEGSESAAEEKTEE